MHKISDIVIKLQENRIIELFRVFSTDLGPFGWVVLLHEVHDALGVLLHLGRAFRAFGLQYLR